MIKEDLGFDEQKIDQRNKEITINLREIGSENLKVVLPSYEKVIESEEGLDTEFEEVHKKKINEREHDLVTEMLADLKQYENEFINSDKFLYHISSLYFKIGDNKNAMSYLEQAASKTSSNYIKKQYAMKTMSLEGFSKGLQLLNHLPKHDYDVTISKALGFLNNKNFKEVRKELLRALKIDPLQYRTYFLLAIVNYIGKDYSNAIRAARFGLELTNQSSTLYYIKGLSYLYLQRPDKAITNLLIAYNINPANIDIALLLSDIYIRNENYVKALSILEQTYNDNDKVPSICDRIAKCYYNLGKYKKALEVLNIQKVYDDNQAVWNNLGLVYQRLGENKKSEICFTNAIKKIEGKIKPIILYNFASYLYDLNEKKRIIDLYKEYKEIELITFRDKRFYVEYIRLVVRSYYEQENIETVFRIADKILDDDQINEINKLSIYNFLLYIQSLKAENERRPFEVIEKLRSILANSHNEVDKDLIRIIKNNIVFFLIEHNLTAEAEPELEDLKHQIRNHDFLSATYGLKEIKNGNIKTGIWYYNNAIRISKNEKIKQIAKQKVNYEMANYYYSRNDKKKAIDYIKAASKVKEGLREYQEKINNMKKIIQEM